MANYKDTNIEDMWSDMDFIDMDEIMELGVAALSGTGAILLSSAALPRVPIVRDNPYFMSGSAIAIGLLGGWLLSKFNKEAGIGLGAAMAGLGLAHLIGDIAGMEIGLGDAVVQEESLLGLSNGAEPEDETLLGLPSGFKDAVVQEEDLFSGTEVEEEEYPYIGTFFQ